MDHENCRVEMGEGGIQKCLQISRKPKITPVTLIFDARGMRKGNDSHGGVYVLERLDDMKKQNINNHSEVR